MIQDLKLQVINLNLSNCKQKMLIKFNYFKIIHTNQIIVTISNKIILTYNIVSNKITLINKIIVINKIEMK